MNFSKDFEDRIANSQKVLLVGAGGDFDILSCLPLYYKLAAEGKELTMVNFSNLQLEELAEVTEAKVLLKDRLFMIGSNMKVALEHYPSGMASRWFEETYQEQVPFYLIMKQSIPSMTECYQKIIEKSDADTILFCGFGMRTLMRGDEEGCGDMLHSTMNLSAVKQLEGIEKLLITFGIEKGVSFNSAMENISTLTQYRGYLGVSHFSGNDAEFHYMKHCYDFIASQGYHERSLLIESIMLGIVGKIGMNQGYRVTPLMSHIHYFDLQSVAMANKIAPMIEHVPDYQEIVQQGMSVIKSGNKARKYDLIQL